MLEASISAMGWTVSNYLVSGAAPRPMGDQNATAAPSGTFHAADGPLNIAANRQTQFETLCRLTGHPEWLTDPRFADREARKQHRDALTVELDAALATRPAAEWEAMLSAAGVPAARILTVPAALDSAQLAHRGFLTDLPLPEAPDGRLRLAGSGVLVDGVPLRPTVPPPRLGEHNAELPRLIEAWQPVHELKA
jgi:crotonobetainyl-CoA:carnitine CoA-transferase CaiB-like acyl-CoA transferase